MLKSERNHDVSDGREIHWRANHSSSVGQGIMNTVWVTSEMYGMITSNMLGMNRREETCHHVPSFTGVFLAPPPPLPPWFLRSVDQSSELNRRSALVWVGKAGLGAGCGAG